MFDRIRIRRMGRVVSILAVLTVIVSVLGASAEAGWPFGNARRRGTQAAPRYYVNPAPRYYYYYATPPVRGTAPRYVVPPVQPRYVVPPGYRQYYRPAPPTFRGAPEIPMPIMMDRSTSGWKPIGSLLT